MVSNAFSEKPTLDAMIAEAQGHVMGKGKGKLIRTTAFGIGFGLGSRQGTSECGVCEYACECECVCASQLPGQHTRRTTAYRWSCVRMHVQEFGTLACNLQYACEPGS